MFIKTLILENFQSHERSVLEFHPNFNCIVGMSNVGKTAISRALSFILFGQWDGSWVRSGEKACKITILTDTGISIIREKGEKVNKYTLKVPGQTDQIYENFGTDIPVAISSVLKMFRVQIDADEYLNLNLSNQLDPLFLLSKTGSYKAKVIGKLSGVHYLDYALRELNKDKRNLSTERTLKEAEVLDLKTQLAEFEGIDSVVERLNLIKAKIDQIADFSNRLERLKSLFSRIEAWKSQYTLYVDKEEKLAALRLPNVDSVEASLLRLDQIRKLDASLDQNLKEKVQKQEQLIKLNEELAQSIEQYKQLLKDNKICPTCLSPIDEDRICASSF